MEFWDRRQKIQNEEKSRQVFKLRQLRCGLPCLALLIVVLSVSSSLANSSCQQPKGSPFYGVEKIYIAFLEHSKNEKMTSYAPEAFEPDKFKKRVEETIKEKFVSCNVVKSPENVLIYEFHHPKVEDALELVDSKSLFITVSLPRFPRVELNESSKEKYAEVKILMMRNGLKYLDLYGFILRNSPTFTILLEGRKAEEITDELDSKLKLYLRPYVTAIGPLVP